MCCPSVHTSTRAYGLVSAVCEHTEDEHCGALPRLPLLLCTCVHCPVHVHLQPRARAHNSTAAITAHVPNAASQEVSGPRGRCCGMETALVESTVAGGRQRRSRMQHARRHARGLRRAADIARPASCSLLSNLPCNSSLLRTSRDQRHAPLDERLSRDPRERPLLVPSSSACALTQQRLPGCA